MPRVTHDRFVRQDLLRAVLSSRALEVLGRGHLCKHNQEGRMTVSLMLSVPFGGNERSKGCQRFRYRRFWTR
jgi:hypothetical protein